MKAALLPTSGEPHLAAYWCRAYTNTWRGEVDELVVYVNGDTAAVPIYASVGARVLATSERLNHGAVIDMLLAETRADTVVLVEDDAFVREPRAIAMSLALVADGIVLGCPRGGMDPAIAEAADRKWGPVVGPDTSSGHGLWPCFLFGRTSDLRAAGSFASRTWGSGEIIPGLGYTVPYLMTTDTASAAAFVLRDRCTIIPIVQHKELWQKDLPEHGAPWLHAGGLSTDPGAARPDIGMDNLEGRDWAHRFWWWRRIGLDYADDYRRARVEPDYWTPIVEPWITWE